MKDIYFACSIRGGRDDAPKYAELVEYINTKANVLTEIFADKKLTSDGMNLPNEEIWQKDINWIGRCDAVIAEVTNPSLGVGYEIAKAEDMKKPVLALFQISDDKKLSAMIAGSQDGVVVANYDTIDAAKNAIDEFILSISKS